MYSLILSLVLSGSVLAERPSVEVDGKDCLIKSIVYDDINNYVHTIGNCDTLYEMCTEDYCKVKKMKKKDLNFGMSDNVGKK